MTNQPGTHLPPGFDLGQYRIEAVVEIDSFGVTYRAKDRDSNAIVTMLEYAPDSVALRTDAGLVQPASAKWRDDISGACIGSGKKPMHSPEFTKEISHPFKAYWKRMAPHSLLKSMNVARP